MLVEINIPYSRYYMAKFSIVLIVLMKIFMKFYCIERRAAGILESCMLSTVSYKNKTFCDLLEASNLSKCYDYVAHSAVFKFNLICK